MSKQSVRKRALKDKLAELRELRARRVEVVKSLWDLKKYYGELTEKINKVKGEIRFLDGEIPIGTEYHNEMMLWQSKRDVKRFQTVNIG